MELNTLTLDSLISWLHKDIDQSIEDAESEVIENYTLMFNILNQIKADMECK